jgi:hypothetical protein
MKKIDIRKKLEEIDVTVDGIVLGDFDFIGELTAKRQRERDDPNYKKVGCFYRANYERGILIYYLIRQFGLKSMLEIGFGRGYATLCAAKAFYDEGTSDAKIVTIDPNLEQQYVQQLSQVFPKQWLDCVMFVKGPSDPVVTKELSDRTFDLIYIDGDHSYAATKRDWEMTKDKYKRFLLFDDYHLPTKDDPGIQCNKLIDEIEDDTKELIIMDRRMFFDDRRVADEDIDYGQVLLSKGDNTIEW